MDQVVPLRYGRQAKPVTISTRLTLTLCHSTSFGKSSNLCPLHTPKHLRCCMVKPHGQLVRVSSTHYYASTPRLSTRSEEHTSELQSRPHLVCRLLLEKKKTTPTG